MFRRLLLLPTALFLAACARQDAAVPGARIATSFYPLTFLAEHVAGGDGVVRQITPAGVEPHDYEPAPDHIAAVYDADVFLMNGGGIDAWGDDLLPRLQERGLRAVRMVDVVDTIEIDHAEEGHPDDDHGAEEDDHIDHGTSGVDPHFWMDPVLMRQALTVVRDLLSEADPASASLYANRAAALDDELARLHADFESGLETCDVRTVIVSHDAFAYLAARYAFEILPIAGLDPHAEPSPRRLAELSSVAKELGITTVFFETLVSPRLAQVLAEEIGAQALVLNPLEGLTPEDASAGQTYLDIQRKNLDNLRTAMRCA